MTDALWSLAADLQQLGFAGRFFAPPLCGFVPDGTSQDPFAVPNGLPQPAVYAFEDRYSLNAPQNDRTVDVTLRITATPISGPFPIEPEHFDLPPPAIRLHAVAKGWLSFDPIARQLILETTSFGVYPGPKVPWFQQWVEAHCTPRLIIYENVDVDHLGNYLRTIPPTGMYGITFPDSKTAPILDSALRDAFVDEFLEGKVDPATGRKTHMLSVQASAVIGQCAPTSAGSSSFRLDLHVRYSEDKSTSPWPMNPRELLYLMFGENCPITTTHPLFTALNTLQPSEPRTSRSKILRPPLRTWGRLMWEAQLEADADQARPLTSRYWSQAGALASDTLVDSVFRRTMDSGVNARVSYGSLLKTPKCNVFTSDITLRAGFRVMIQEAGSQWHYPLSNAQAHCAVSILVAKASAPPGRYPIMGQGADAGRVWGYALTKYLYAQSPEPPLTFNEAFNAMMKVQGRAFILAGARKKPPSKSWGTGHIVLLGELTDTAPTDNPDLKTNDDTMLPIAEYPRTIKQIWILAAQASSDNGALANQPSGMVLGGHNTSPGGTNGFIRIHLIEAAPGGDPDLLQGLWDLHVIRRDRAQLNAPIDT